MTNIRVYAALAGIIALASLPFWATEFVLTLGIVSLVSFLVVISFSFLAGQLGLTSLMQASIAGLAGYGVAYLQVTQGFPFPIPFFSALGIGVAVSAVLGLALVRTRGIYFLMLTMVLALSFWSLALQWVSITKGTTGIIGVRAPVIFGTSLSTSPRGFYYFVFFIAVIAFAFFSYLKTTRFGLCLKGIRDNEQRMRSLGYPINLYVWIAWVVSSVPATLGGTLLVYYLGVMNPHNMTIAHNVNVVLAGILGGVESYMGAFGGAVLLKLIDNIVSAWTERYQLIGGVLFILIILGRLYATDIRFLPRRLLGVQKRR